MSFPSLRHRFAFRNGTRLLRQGRWWPAAVLLGRAASWEPTHWESHNNLAIALLKLERWEDAARAARRAIQLDPQAVDSHDFLGIALLQLERWEEAAATYERAVTLGRSRYDSYDRLGMALMQLERWQGVVDAYDAALRLEANRYAAHQRLGIALQRLRRWDAAAAAFRRAIELAANDPAAAGEVAGLELSLASVEARLDVTPASPQQLPSAAVVAQLAERQAAFWTEENLGADVFAAERWLEELSAAPRQTRDGEGPRLLFVLDNDFGELTTLEYFLLGQELAGRSTLLLPDRLYAHNADAIPGRTHRYGSVQDVLQVVDRERPGIVFLCSAYLFCAHHEWTVANLERLVGELRTRGCRVVTADPYLGMLSKQDPRTLIRFEISREHAKKLASVAHIPDAVAKMKAVHAALAEQAWEVLRQSERTLRDAYHLYPSFCDAGGHDAVGGDARNISFFNERLVRPVRSAPQAHDTRHWLFILASADYDIQSVTEGDVFADVVARKLEETRAAGRHPVLIAPKEFLDEVLLRLSSVDGIDLLSHCPFSRYMSLLLSAEHVFYWNVVSHSILIRLFNQLPVVLFDRGHLLRTVPAIRDRIVAWYYQGFEAPIRDHHEPLTLERVDGWAAEYRRHSARLVERFRRAPSPDEMIAQLTARAPTAAQQTTLSYR